jgi:membrane-bound serine protease (ClpP class)
MHIIRIVGGLLLLTIAAIANPKAHAQSGGPVLVTDLRGAIGVAAERHVSRALAKARQDRASAVVIRLDTPGGLVSATRDIIRELIAAPVPVVVYVAPSGARAASAGTFLVYAAHIAAMAPGTNMGAATPIQIGTLPGLPPPRDSERPGEQKQAPGQQSAAERKAVNDVVAMLRSLAQLRGRNVEWAEKAVREAATLSADEARREGVIDVVAGNIDDLLRQLEGRRVTVDGSERSLTTTGVGRMTFEPDLTTRVLAVISDPNLAFILLLIGIYGVLLEFWSPGVYFPGVIGAISLILALMALSTLPVQYAALGLLLLGIGLMIGEIFTPGIGALGIGGLVAFLAGSFFLFEPSGADIEIAVSLPLILGAAATTAGLLFFVGGAAIKSRRRPPSTGAEEMLGSVGRVIDWQNSAGHIRVHGEIWAARGDQPLQPGTAVRVVAREGLRLIVEPQ